MAHRVTLMQSAEYYRTEGIEIRAYESKFPTALWYPERAGRQTVSSITISWHLTNKVYGMQLIT